MPRPRMLRLAVPLAAVALFASLLAHAQSFLDHPLPQRQTQQQQQQAPPPPSSPVIARVEGRPITQQDFDRIADPYLAQLRAQLRDGFTADVVTFARLSVLDELFRRELLAVEAQRQKIAVSDAEVDRLLMQDPFFLTNGKFDANKFSQYKVSPGSNYLQVLPRLRELAAANKVDSLLRARFTPATAALRAEWSKRNDQVRFKFLPLLTRDVSLDPEATADEIAAYYAAHPQEFERRRRARMRFVRLEVPDPDTLGAGESARRRAQTIADSLKKDVPIDSIVRDALEIRDSGLLEMPPPAVPGLGREPELVSAFAAADSVPAARGVVGPVAVAGGWVVGAVTERTPRMVPPFAEVRPEVKRRADTEKRLRATEAERSAWYQAHLEAFRVPRVRISRALLRDAALTVKEPNAKEVGKWFAARRATDSTLANATLGDSLRLVLKQRMAEEARTALGEQRMARLAADWRAGRDARSLARAAGATFETLTVVRGSLADAVFPAPFLDSTLTAAIASGPGAVHGPRTWDNLRVVWRIDRVDTSMVSPLESVVAQVDGALAEEKRVREEQEGRAHFEANRTTYRTKERIEIDYVAVKVPAPDSVAIPEPELRAYYRSHAADYREEEQVRARHILISNNPAQTPGGETAAKARIDSLATLIRAGAAFEAIARDFSQDPSNAAQGGDLGFFARGRMVKEFSDTSFALPIGRVSQPVRTSFGWHLIRVDERRAAGVRPFAEVRPQIQLKLGQARGDSTARRRAASIRRQIVAGGDAAKLAVPVGGVVHTTPFPPGESVPGLGYGPELMKDLAALPLARWAPKVYKVGAAYVLVRPTRRVPPGPAEFADVRPQAMEDAKNVRRKELLAARVADVRARLAAGATLDSVAAAYGGLKDSGPQVRASQYLPYVGSEPRVVPRVFGMKAGEVSDTLHTANGVVWVQSEGVGSAAGASFEKDRAALSQELLQKRYADWIEQKKKTVKVEILRADLRGKKVVPTRTVTIGG